MKLLPSKGILACALFVFQACVPSEKTTQGHFFDYVPGVHLDFSCKTNIPPYTCSFQRYNFNFVDDTLRVVFVTDVLRDSASIIIGADGYFFLAKSDILKKYSFLHHEDSCVYRFYINPKLKTCAVVQNVEYKTDDVVQVRLKESSSLGVYFHEEIWRKNQGLIWYRSTNQKNTSLYEEYSLIHVKKD